MDFSKKYETEAGEDTELANLTRLLAKKFVSQLSTKERKGLALGREVAQGVLSAKEAKVKAVANSTSGGGDDNDDFASCEAIDGPASTSKKASDQAQKKVSGKKRDRGEDTSQEKTSSNKEEEGKATSATAGRNVADLKKLRPENEKEKKTKNKSPASSSLAAPALVGEKEMLAALASLRSSASQKAKGSKKSVEGKLEKSDAKAVMSSGMQKQPTPQHLADESDQDLDTGDSLEDEEEYFDEEGEEFEDEEEFEEGEEFEDEEEFDAADEELEEEEEELEEEDDNACSLKKVAPAPTFGSSTPLSGNGTTAAAATSKENKRVKTEAELIADEEAELSKYNFDDAFEGDAEQAMLDAISIPSTDEDEEEIGEEEEGDEEFEGEEDEESDDEEDYTAQRGKGKTGSALPASTKGTKQGLRPEQASVRSERGGNKKGTALPPPPPPVPQVKVKAVNPMTLSRQQAAKLKQQQQRMQQQQQQHQQQGNNKGGGGGNKKKGGGGGGLYSGGNQAGWSDDD